MSNRFLRNKDLITQDKLDEITIIGAGGIGSALCHQSSIMGFPKFIIWDDDKIEEHNRSSTMYKASSVGTTKVDEAETVIKMYSPDAEVVKENRKWQPEHPLGNKVFICTDNMEIRKFIYESWIGKPELERANGFLIDMRMSALTMEILAVRNDHDNFMAHWQPSDQIDDDPCTMKYTIFNTGIVAGMGLTLAYQIIEGLIYYGYTWINLAPFDTNYLERINIVSKENRK